MSFELTILGSGSASPTPDRFASSQFLNFANHYILIDCGEGSQIQMMRFGVKSFKVDMIFISHLHPDHYLGLPGFISSLGLKGRMEPLDIYCPVGLKEILEVQFQFGEVHLGYEIRYHVFAEEVENVEFEDQYLKIYSFPLNHRVTCRGFLFQEKKSVRKINKPANSEVKLPNESYPVLRSGHDFTDKTGKVWEFEKYTLPNEEPFSYMYITDTTYLPELAEQLSRYKVHTLYHEATFLDELKDKAKITCHSTAKEAAEFAVKAGVKRLILGHFSSRYKDLEPLLNEARELFGEVFLATDGAGFEV